MSARDGSGVAARLELLTSPALFASIRG